MIDTITDLHFHKTTPAILAQVLGEKRVLLHPPSQTRLLYPRPW